jgi:hypothetical protein
VQSGCSKSFPPMLLIYAVNEVLYKAASFILVLGQHHCVNVYKVFMGPLPCKCTYCMIITNTKIYII